MAQKRETTFRKRVDKFLNEMYPPIFHESIQQKTIRGTPDKLCCINGYFVGLELKVGKGTTTKIQEYKIQKIIDSKGICFVLCPENFEDMKGVLKELNRREEIYDNKIH